MKLLFATLAASAALALAACESDGYYSQGYGRSSGYYGYSPRTAWNYGWYDNFYGPVYDGYWGPGDVFFYRTAPGGSYYSDPYRHFRHDRFNGGLAFRFESRRYRG